MRHTLRFTALFCLLMSSFVYAQQTTFDFTAGTRSGSGFGQTWSQTVNGITCNVSSSNPDNLSPSINPIIDDSSTNLISSEGLWMGTFITPSVAAERNPFHRPGASITFSHDVRLKSYTFGRKPNNINNFSFCYLQGGNVTALALHGGNADPYQGTRSFDLEAVIPAGTPLITCVKQVNPNGTFVWRFASLTVEPETYVEPDIQIPEGNETGVTRVGSSYINSGSDYKNSFALKNGRLLVWGSSFYSVLFHFDGAGSGVLDFWLATTPTLLVETVEGFALFSNFQYDDDRYSMNPLSGTLPANPDQVDLSTINEPFVMALKDGEVYFDGPEADEMRNTMPAEIAAGGVSEIAAALETALAVKDGKLYMWGSHEPGSLVLSNGSIPDEVANGEVVHLAADGIGAFVQLSTGELIKFGSTGVRPSAEQTAGTEIFADLIAKDHNLMTLRQDGSFYINDRFTDAGDSGSRYDRYGYDEVPFYVDSGMDSDSDYNVRGLEAIPSIIQKLGYDQIALTEENIIATTPSGRVVIWGGTDVNQTGNATDAQNPIQGDSVPTQINEILFPQTNVAKVVKSDAPDAAELSMLEAGGLGIQWGASNTPYEVQTTTDMLNDTSWEPLPVDANNRFYRINPAPSN